MAFIKTSGAMRSLDRSHDRLGEPMTLDWVVAADRYYRVVPLPLL